MNEMYMNNMDRKWIGELLIGVKKNLVEWDKGNQNREESLKKIGLLCREIVRVCEEG